MTTQAPISFPELRATPSITLEFDTETFIFTVAVELTADVSEVLPDTVPDESSTRIWARLDRGVRRSMPAGIQERLRMAAQQAVTSELQMAVQQACEHRLRAAIRKEVPGLLEAS